MNTRPYPWRTAFLCAVFETDPAKMPARVSKATKAIDARLAGPQLDTVEHSAIENARSALVTLGAATVSVLGAKKDLPS
jgi:hypothetical protein